MRWSCSSQCRDHFRDLVPHQDAGTLILGMNNIAISITGFSGLDLPHVEKLISLIGAQYYVNLTRKRSLLLTPDVQIKGPKTIRAREWGIPVVNVNWLWEVLSRGDEDVGIGPYCDGHTSITLFLFY